MTETVHDNDRARILAFLTRSDAWFEPGLSQRVDLVSYADKLAGRAANVFVQARAPEGTKDIGHAAVYVDCSDGAGAFLSSFAIDPEWRGTNEASNLLSTVERFVRSQGCLHLRLEANEANGRALSFYEKLGYKPMSSRSRGDVLLEKQLGAQT